MSKMPPEGFEPLVQVFQLASNIFERHAGLSNTSFRAWHVRYERARVRLVLVSFDYGHAIYAGSFDPITLGHTAIIERAAQAYKKLTVAIGRNPSKSGLFPPEKRKELILASLGGKYSNVEIAIFSGLLVEFARESGAGILLRGLRLLTDFEHEFQLALANRKLEPRIETVFMITESEHLHVSSSLVKEIAAYGGDFGHFVSSAVRQAMLEKFPPKKL